MRYRGASLIRNTHPPRIIIGPRATVGSYGGVFRMDEVPLYRGDGVTNHPGPFVGVSQSQFFRDVVNIW